MPFGKWTGIIEYVPFISLMAGRPSSQTPLFTKLLETAIMSAVAGAFATYVGVELLKSDVSQLKTSIKEVDGKVEKLDDKVERIRRDLYVPRAGQ